MRETKLIGKFYKPKDKFEALNLTSQEKRTFEKKDYAFSIIGVGGSAFGEDKDLEVMFLYQGETFMVDLETFYRKCKPALTSKDIEKYIILKYITGSRAYGTNIPESDTDYKAVFILPDHYYSDYEFDEEFEEIKEKDVASGSESTYYSLRKFVHLLGDQNPNMLEVFNIPADCLVYKHSCLEFLLTKLKNEFLTKKCYYTFLSYGESQIQKAQGQDKMQNWEKARMERKGVLDFCYVPYKQGSINVLEWLGMNGYSQEHCGLANIPHMKYTYALFYGEGKKYKGIVSNGEDEPNDVSLSSILKDDEPVITMQFNKDAYSTHCKDYRRFLTWKEERNEQRWVDVKGHDQKIDGKNMLHCMRLIYMSEDIAAGRGIIVRRPEREYLISIRRGEVDLKTLIEDAQQRLIKLKEDFANSDIPDEMDQDLCREVYHYIKNRFDNESTEA